MSSSTPSLAARLETEVSAFKSLQNEIAKLLGARQQLDAQLRENQIVLQEFKLLKGDAVVYKLTGPILVKQETVESVHTVEKRIEFIKTELKRLEDRVHTLEEQQNKHREQISQLQMMRQAPQVPVQ